MKMSCLWLRAIFLVFLIKTIRTADPVEQLFRSLALSARQFGEKWISGMPIPSMDNMGGYPGGLMFNIDPKTAAALGSLTEFLNECPAPQFTDISGSWAIIFASRQLLQTLFQDVDEAVDRLMMGQMLNPQKTLGSLFRQPARVECSAVVVNQDGSFELSYSVLGRPKSIIGAIHVNGDQTMAWQFAPTAMAEFTVIYSSQVAEPTARDVLILGQTDTFPKCENVLVLARTRLLYESIFSHLTQNGHNTATNPLLPIECRMLGATNPFLPTGNPLLMPGGIGVNPPIPQVPSVIRPIR